MVRPKKHLGQHFLQDENIARKIIGYLSPGSINVVEVGPGTGILSKYLLENNSVKPYFFEIDPESVDYLLQKYPAMEGKLFREDFLEADLSGIPSPYTVIGNFPYNISSQILFRVLEYRDRIPEVIGMFQKEVAERIASPPGSKRYGILSVLLQAYYDIGYLFTVNEGVFYPPPRVKSAVIRLRRNTTLKLDCDEKMFFLTVKTAFNQRRKTLRNALKAITAPSAASSPGIKEMLGKRAEQMSVEDFVMLSRVMQV